MKDAAKEVHHRFYKYCTSSFNDIVNTDNVRDLRRVVIRYRDYVSDPRAAHYIRENYADVLEALGLRIQFTSMAVYGVFGKLISPITGMEQPPL